MGDRKGIPHTLPTRRLRRLDLCASIPRPLQTKFVATPNAYATRVIEDMHSGVESRNSIPTLSISHDNVVYTCKLLFY